MPRDPRPAFELQDDVGTRLALSAVAVVVELLALAAFFGVFDDWLGGIP